MKDKRVLKTIQDQLRELDDLKELQTAKELVEKRLAAVEKKQGKTLTRKPANGYNAASMSTATLQSETPTLGQKIAEKRHEKGMSQQALAQKSGLSFVSINRFENGHAEPKIGSLAKIAAALGLATNDLLAGV